MEVSGSEKLRYDHRTPNVASEGKCNENQSDLIAVSYSGEGVFSDKFACNKTVGNVIELLKDNAAKEGQTKFPKYIFRSSDRKILVHGW